MGKISRFITGVTVATAVNRIFERWSEPRLRRKAQREGFAAEFEQELSAFQACGADTASSRAFLAARRRYQQGHL
jgi:hypothetical protein